MIHDYTQYTYFSVTDIFLFMDTPWSHAAQIREVLLYALVISHHQGKFLLIAKSFDFKWSHEKYSPDYLGGTILSQIFKEYAPVISHHQSNRLPGLQVTVVTIQEAKWT